MGLTRCYKTEVFLHLYEYTAAKYTPNGSAEDFCWSESMHGRRYLDTDGRGRCCCVLPIITQYASADNRRRIIRLL